MERKGVPIKKKSLTSKSHAEYTKVSRINAAIDQMYQIALKSILSSIIPHCPKEILIEISNFINAIFSQLQDRILNSIMKHDSVKRRELAWKNVTNKVIDILHPLIHAINIEQKPLLQVPNPSVLMEVNHSEKSTQEDSNTLNHAIKAYAQRRSTEKSNTINIYWPKPLEINFLQIKDADDVATISCKVGDITIPYAMIDSGSDSSIISENVAKHLGLRIDRKKVHRINGVASKSKSLGTIDNVPVTISNGKDELTATDEFSVVPTEKDDNGKELSLFILGTQWQYRAGWEPLVNGEFKATQNGKTITIPLSVHKSQRNVFTIEKELISIKKN